MANWGEAFDEELMQMEKEKIEVGVMFSYKSMSAVIERIANETREWDDKHPKRDLLKIWTNLLPIFFVLFLFSYNVMIIATGIFYFFYGYILIQLFGVWRRFHYSKLQFWGMTVGALSALFAIAWFLRGVILG